MRHAQPTLGLAAPAPSTRRSRRLPHALLAAFAALLSATAVSQEIADPRHLLFAADIRDPVIDVVDLREGRAVYRIATGHTVDDIAVTPNAPLLIYSSAAERTVTLFDLRAKEVRQRVELPFEPRHLVLNPRGDRLAVSDSERGGFALLSSYDGSIVLLRPDFPATGDALFDPNDVDVYYSNPLTGALGIIDTNTRAVVEVAIAAPGERLSSPSRSLDGRYVYVANDSTGEVYGLNAFSRAVYRTFDIGPRPARPYTTPEGSFLYLLERATGRFVSVEQFNFERYADTTLGAGMDLVAVGRFDRMNLFATTAGTAYRIYDNVQRTVVQAGEFSHTPLDAQGAGDGRRAYVAFRDAARIAVVDLEGQSIEYIDATSNGVGAFAVGHTNNVCH